MSELLVVATQAAVDARPLVSALERLGPAGTRASAAPGLLSAAPGGEDELVRDAARRRGARILVLVPGGPDLLNHALLTVAAAREAGLAVPAVVVAGPGGHDQRADLRRLALTDVVELPDPAAPAQAVAGWPVADWAAAEVTVAAGGRVALTPYGGWEPHAVPDPRSAGRERIAPVLLEIIQAEGPVLASRAFGLYNKAAGGKKLTTIARAPLSASAFRLRATGDIEIVEPGTVAGQDEEVLRVAGSPAVRVRELGTRTLEEVPLDEIAELMDRLASAGADDLARATLTAYGLVRMTTRTAEQLALAEEIAISRDDD